MVCDLPCKVISTFFFNVPLYWMANLRHEPGSFFVFLLFGFTTTLTMSTILRTISQTSRTIHQALTPAAMFILGLVIYTGFILPTSSMQGWLRWIGYLNPLSYAFESIMANEFSHRDFPCAQFIPAGPQYLNSSSDQRTCSVAGALPGQSYITGDLYISQRYDYLYSHLWRYTSAQTILLFYLHILIDSTVEISEFCWVTLCFLRWRTSWPRSISCQANQRARFSSFGVGASPVPPQNISMWNLEVWRKLGGKLLRNHSRQRRIPLPSSSKTAPFTGATFVMKCPLRAAYRQGFWIMSTAG